MKQKVLDLIDRKLKDLYQLAEYEKKKDMAFEAGQTEQIALNIKLLRKQIEELEE